MRATAAVLVVGAAVAACRFDPAGVAGDDDPRRDAPPTDGALVDAAICPSPTARISVDGVVHDGAGGPAAVVLVGDTVALGSHGSCGPGPLTYQWQVSPVTGVRDTLAPGDDAPAITVYPTLADRYSVTLTVRAPDGSAASETIYAFDARGFAPLATRPRRVRDLEIGGGRLWVASGAGTFSADLDAPADLAEVDGRLPRRAGAVVWDPTRDALWVGAQAPSASVWRIDGGDVVEVDVAAILGGVAVVSDLAVVVEPMPGAIAVATDRGVAFAADGVAFEAAFGGGAAAVAEAGETWVLGDLLRSVDSGRSFIMVDTGEPTAMVSDLDGGGVWVAIDGEGVAHARFVGDGIAVARFDVAGGLPSPSVRALAIERDGRFAGDVWAATARGLARWKADREVWVAYGNPQGLQGFLDLSAVAVGGPRRTVFAGGASGLVYAAQP
jgi:hypothetical protein